MQVRVLLVEDDVSIASPLLRNLEREGYDVTWVESGAAALAEVEAAPPQAVILDLGLPDMDGLEVCLELRDRGYDGGLLITSARSRELDRVTGLDHGADDYLPKPFGLAELQARVRALLRRTQGYGEEQPEGLRVDVEARRAFNGEDEIPLTSKEFDLLAALAERRDKVVTRDELMAKVWDEAWYGSTKTLDVSISRLRHKLENAGVEEVVVAVRGVGFRLERPSDQPASL